MAGITVTISATDELIAAIDESATKAGLSRSAYILQWIPEAHTLRNQSSTERDARSARKSQRLADSLARTERQRRYAA